jgi:hypothetical protein
MQGTYIGTYKYDKHYIEYINTETMFTLIITDYDGIAFKGTITDDLVSGGTRGEGIVEGTLKDGKIEFIKQMPIMTLVTKKGIKIEVQKKHKPIYYSGVLLGEVFEGKWKIKRGMIFSKFVIAWGTGATGTWKMTQE